MDDDLTFDDYDKLQIELCKSGTIIFVIALSVNNLRIN